MGRSQWEAKIEWTLPCNTAPAGRDGVCWDTGCASVYAIWGVCVCVGTHMGVGRRGGVLQHGMTRQKGTILGPVEVPASWRVLAFGQEGGRTLPVCSLCRKWTRTQQASVLGQQQHSFLGSGAWADRGHGSLSLPSRGCAQPMAAALATPRGDSTAVLLGRHNVPSVPKANTPRQATSIHPPPWLGAGSRGLVT